jgi:L-ascorbate metabolism protein UlaG (beta-lactamase superfamily)
MNTTLKYLGVAGWEFSYQGKDTKVNPYRLVLDPYFTRISMARLVFGRAVPDKVVIARYMPPADAILVTHPHYDHIMDVPEAARISGAQVWASPQGCELLGALNVPASQICVMRHGDMVECGPFRVEVYESKHRKVFGGIPYYGALKQGLRPPLRGLDYRMDVQFSFRVTAGDVRVLVTSGIDDEPLVEADVLLVGADINRDQLAPVLEACKPRLVMPNHWDDMFRPLSKPIRPMMTPPPTPIPNLKRINLVEWEKLVRMLAPGVEVMIPRLFEPIQL